MSVFLSNLSTNDSSLWKENLNSTDLLNPPGTLNIYLFCLADCSSSYVLLLFAVYSSAFGLLAALSVPLIHQLLCSDEPLRLYANYQEISRGTSTPGTPSAGERVLSLSPDDALGPALRCFAGCSPSSDTVFGPVPPERAEHARGPGRLAAAGAAASRRENPGTLYGTRSFTIHMVVQHVVGFQSLPFESLSFLLTLLATTVTPVFVLSKHWTHLPCGCIINCKQDAYAVASDGKKSKRRGFEFNISFERIYGIYKIAHENYYDDDENSTSYHNLMNYECKTTKDSQRGTHNIFNAIKVEISTTPSLDSSTLKGINKSTNTDSPEAQEDSHNEKGVDPLLFKKSEGDIHYEETTFLEGPERRLSHEESQKPDLSDWEWCRSKSERTPRQRAGGALAIPLCAFQGMVSLQAPTGKTLSLSTYEVSAEGQKITPASKKIEVYRSKSVGHEPNSEDSPSTFADTSVKIHLEVLEICDNEEALDTVSIISNISQSSAQVRSPSLRYSRKENRFVSCDLGETASYSLFLPTSNPDGDINISIPDTVEAHRRNSKRQHQDREGYQEEIQLLNTAYRKREEESKGS
ncbi:G protein-coupled receptor 149 [Phyllostomus discolor]|uniref:G protein-coupled receptor 149 n=1 Tax=Phyllostomus discolor TaxID=89673 RepID=A0A834AUJ9_9CHIR|nr:G protein-coupled receptor 149 [Phyllostomus discolor]